MLKKSIELLTYSNVWVSLCIVGLTAVTPLSMGEPISYSYLLFVFLGTWLTYNIQRYIKYQKDPIDRKNIFPQNHLSKIKWIGLAVAMILLFIFITFELETQVILGLAAVLSLLYLPPFFADQWSLREVPYVKIFLIAAVWTLVSFGSHLLEVRSQAIVGRFLFLLAITLPFDIRDMEKDHEYGLKTIPLWLGLKSTKLLGIVLFVVAIYLEGAIQHDWLLHFFGLLGGLMLLNVSHKKRELYYGFTIESLSLLYFVLMWLSLL